MPEVSVSAHAPNPVKVATVYNLHTYEVECRVCGKLKWPTLPDKPTSYVCALCTMVADKPSGRRSATSNTTKSLHMKAIWAAHKASGATGKLKSRPG